MTCIVGIIDNKSNTVLIGADSAGISSNDISIRKDVKVFKKDGFVIGCTTSFRMIQLLRYSFEIPVINNKELFEYMCTDFINAVRKCFTDGGFMQKGSKGDEIGGTFLIGYHNRLFQIDSDFQVAELQDNYNAIGCGDLYAKGSLFSTKKMSTKKRIITALKAAQYHCIGVSEPFIIEET